MNKLKLAALIILYVSFAASPALAQSSAAPEPPGKEIFQTRCASCHGTTGNGGEFAPRITDRVPLRTDDDLRGLLHNGLPTSGMPSFATLTDAEVTDVIAYVRTLRPPPGSGPVPTTVTLTDSKTLHGLALNKTVNDMQMLGDDQRLHLLRREGTQYREVTSQTDWATYNGQLGGSRYSALTQINKANAASLVPKWIYPMTVSRSQVTPLVVNGVMFVTAANECIALDAGNGREIWHYKRSLTKGQIGIAAQGVNRGAAVLGDRVFMSTDNGHLIALNRANGKLLWETPMAPPNQNYNGTGAPLVVDNLVVSGIAGGDEGVRGFLAAFDPESGKEMWRFWSVPAPGEPGSETWGAGLDHPGGATWLTGSFDPQLDTLYWAIGNPSPDLNGEVRPGNNLYTDSVVALDPKTGKLRWYFQFTPHDVHDFDPAETLALVDANWNGEPRKLLVQANRNGFFYVLDRTNGRYVFGTQYSKKVTWASGLTPEGKPIVVANQEATPEGNRICPWLIGASNYFSTSYNPITGLYYVQTDDKCGIYTKRPADWKQGVSFMNGSFSADPADTEPEEKILRAFDIHTGKPVWELPEVGSSGASFGGVLSTSGSVVIFGDDSGSLVAADATTGKPLWSFPTNTLIKASPITYEFDHQQYVAIAAGANIVAFGLPDTKK
jgi:alcohol dehydrogenase (cytochrome c)